jgi:hypothetical protein
MFDKIGILLLCMVVVLIIYVGFWDMIDRIGKR